MSKLFNVMGGDQVVFESVGSGVLPDEDFARTLADEDEALCVATEASEMALERLKCVQGMQAHLSVQKPCSAAYFTSLESYSPIVRSLGEKLGVKHLPSMEDFKNPHAAKDAHNFAMEGFKEMISKAWEKIKSFFRDFFKKISVFVRRLIKANLDLESYEKYCEQLIAKLKANDAKITDTSPMPSELPKLLAGRGDVAMDSDYVLNQGSVKISNLLHNVNQMSFQGGGGKLHQDLVEYEKDLKAFVQANTKASQGGSEFEGSLKELQDKGFLMITSLFKHTLTTPKDVPGKAFEALVQHYSRKDIETEGFMVLSIADPYDPYRDLPRGVNMYLCHVKESNFFICSSKDQGDSAVRTLEPIAKLNNLVDFHKNYKSTLGSFKVKGLEKDADAIASSVDKILSLLQRDFSAMVEGHKELKVSYTPEFLASLFRLVITKNGKAEDSIDEAVNFVNDLLKDNPNTQGGDFNTSVAQLFDAFKTPTSNVDVSINAMKQITDTTHKEHLIAFINIYMHLNRDVLGEVSVEDGESRSKKLRELNTFLSSLFLRLQSLYKGITTDFYSVLTELRYAVIKYIYDSAKRYSY